jgi:hypothetical protein
MFRALLIAGLVFGMAGAANAAEESSTSGDRLYPNTVSPRRGPPPPQVYRPQPDFRPVFRPDPRPVYRPEPTFRPDYRPVYRPEPPRFRFGTTCVTRRFQCETRRPQPIGSDCGCRGPFGGLRPGVVR